LVTFGSYDVVAEFETDTQSQMNEVVTTKIRKLKKIRSTITLRAMD
ncbi:MAG: Lrp/AsnC family transcriptional regulator, partial [Nitrosopumilus sp.]